MWSCRRGTFHRSACSSSLRGCTRGKHPRATSATASCSSCYGGMTPVHAPSAASLSSKSCPSSIPTVRFYPPCGHAKHAPAMLLAARPDETPAPGDRTDSCMLSHSLWKTCGTRVCRRSCVPTGTKRSTRAFQRGHRGLGVSTLPLACRCGAGALPSGHAGKQPQQVRCPTGCVGCRSSPLLVQQLYQRACNVPL